LKGGYDFNPDWRQYFKVLDTQFQSSIISLIQGKVTNFDGNIFTNLPKSVQKSIECEFKNNYFKKLSAKVDIDMKKYIFTLKVFIFEKIFIKTLK